VVNGLLEGAVPNAKIPVLSSGRNNWNSIGNGVETKMLAGLVKAMSLSTAVKSAVGMQAAGLYKTMVGGGLDTARTIMDKPRQANGSNK
jgi:hypothetical protein